MILQTELLNSILYELTTVTLRNSLNPGKVFYVLFNSERLKNWVLLGAVAQQFSHFLEVFLHVKALDADLSVCWFFTGGQNLESCGFSGAVDSE